MTILDPFWTPFGPLFRPLLAPIWTPSDLSQEVLGGLIRGYMEVYVPIYMPPGKGPFRALCTWHPHVHIGPHTPPYPLYPLKGGLEGYPRGPNCPILGSSGPPKRHKKALFGPLRALK